MSILEYLNNNILILDGGMGTMLQNAGIKPGERSEAWNISHPDQIINIHKQYYDAGSNVVLANMFGANSLHYDEKEMHELIAAAMENANKARDLCDDKHNKFVAIDIGPTGQLLEPLGELAFEDAVNVFAKQIKAATEYDADVIVIETMNDSYETKAALLAAKENSSLPVFVSNAYDENNKLLTGADAAGMIAMLEGMGADAIGVNCSFGPDRLKPVVEEYLKYASIPVILKPNAGMPHDEDGKTVYDFDVNIFADIVCELINKGVRIVGGCCGTTPEYISELSKKIKDLKPIDITKKDETIISSYSKTLIFSDEPVLIGERINPTGKKRFKQALIENDIDHILSEGIKQQDMGVHVLDVNVGLPDINEPEMLENVVKELQAVCDLPLQIDTSDVDAMERAMRVYNGKALINSVNGKKEVMEKVFPLQKKYGGVIVALTLDENGIPKNPDDRFEIAKNILNVAKSYGIDKKDIIFDTLTMAVSADKDAAISTLISLKRITDELNAHTVLGVSNVSFGLPERSAINSTFFIMALENGLSAAIMNPFSADMMKSYYTYRAIKAFDDNCIDYIDFAKNLKEAEIVIENKVENDLSNEYSLENSILKGMKEQAAKITSDLLKDKEPLDIVTGSIIPALDKAGIDYENGKIYLPQLLMTAEAAKAGFEKIKEKVPTNESSKGIPFVIATVKGDIHDIGKNIVKLLLENYGYDVIDLGKDVSPEDILDAVIKNKAPFAGLSALMTTTVPAMEETVTLIHKKVPECKVVVGGAVLNEEYAKKIGADKYAKDAMETIRYVDSICGSDN